MSTPPFEFDNGAPRRVIRPLTVPLDGISGVQKGINRRQVVVVVVEQAFRPIQLDRFIDRHTCPLSRHSAQRAKHDNEDGKSQPLQDAHPPPDRTILAALRLHPAAKTAAVAYLRLMRTIRIRTMIVIVTLVIHNHDNPFSLCV